MRLAIDGSFDISVGCVDEDFDRRDGWRACCCRQTEGDGMM